MADQQDDQGQLAQKVYGTLKDAPVGDDVKAQAWEAFKSANSPQDFKKAFDPMSALPDAVKHALWEYKQPTWRSAAQANVPPGAPQTPDRKLAQDEPWYNRAIVPLDKLVAGPQKDQPWYEQFGRGAVQGAAASGANLTSPKNLLIGGAMLGANAIPVVGEFVDAGASLLMGAEQAKRVIDSIPAAKKAFQDGDWGKLGNIVGDDVASAAMGKKAAERGVGRIKGKFGQGSTPDTTPAGANNPTPPPPGAPPTYPLIEAGKPQAQAGAQGPHQMPGDIQGTLPAGQAPPQQLPGGQQPRQLGPATQIQMPGTPTARPMPGDAQRPSGLAIEAGGSQGTSPPPGAGYEPGDPNYQPEPGTGRTPTSHQLEEPVSRPQPTFEESLQMARDMPKDQLQNSIQGMMRAVINHAAEIKDPAERTKFVKQAKTYLDQFHEVYRERFEEDASGVGGEKKKSGPKPKATPKPKEESPKAADEQKPGAGESSNIGQGDPVVVDRIGNQLKAAKAKGIGTLKLTIDRGTGKSPVEIGVNPELDTPESIAAQIEKQGGAQGMATFESADPEHPLKWKFLLGDAPAPPGAK
jgi:hypothetical protein